MIGKRIYYDKISGNVIVDTGEKTGAVRELLPSEEISIYKALSERNLDSFDYIELEYGQYSQDFTECIDYKINVENKKIEFNYEDFTNDIILEKEESLSTQINKNKDYLLDLDFRLTMIELGLI